MIYRTLTRILTAAPALVLAVFLAVGCGGAGEEQPVEPKEPGETVKSNKQRVSNPEVSGEDLELLSEGNTAFAFDLYRQLGNEEEGNLFYSPLSISIALAMTYAGANGDTKAEMADALNFILPEPELHEAFNALDQELESRGEDAKGADGDAFRLRVVNALWGQTGYSFLDAFLDVLALNYGAGMTLLDFISDPEAGRIIINDWVAEKTEDRIKDLIPEGAITEYTRLVLTNAVYFNASWLEAFDEEATQDGEFSTPNGPVTVPMMRQTTRYGYVEGEGYEAVELPYDGEELSMVIITPEEGAFSGIEASLDGEFIEELVESIVYHDVDLTMPKFSFTQSFSVKNMLQAMGMNAAFNAGQADFSGIDGTLELFIQDVIHKAFVAVDEAGTEAAAATAVIVGTTSVPEIIKVTIDRPFIFFIRDIQTGAVVFVGRVLDPTA